MSLPRTLGELRRSAFSEERLRTRRVKDELRDNLIARLRRDDDDTSIFPGIVGYDDTVVPQIVNAVLSRHNARLRATTLAWQSSRGEREGESS